MLEFFFYLVKYTKTFAFDIRGNDISNGETMYAEQGSIESTQIWPMIHVCLNSATWKSYLLLICHNSDH